MTITADELAKVHAFYLTEGDAYSVFAEDLGREVERLRNEEAAATESAYLEELARIQYDAECAYALDEQGCELSSWDETTKFQRGVTTAGVAALLAKLAADGRLTDRGTVDEPAVAVPRVWSISEVEQIPHDVTVRDQDGHEWAWAEGMHSTGWHRDGRITAFKQGPNPYCAPFTEMIKESE